jgi:Domain of unknown function (DUF222)
MPTACAAELREDLLARIGAVTRGAASRQDAELAAELAALAAGGGLTAPGAGDPWQIPPDPGYGPPDGPDAWLADLPVELLDEYLAATQAPAQPEAIVAGRLPRQPGGGRGFAAGGAADDLPPGAALAGLAGDVWAVGLDRLCDDELIGVLQAARRLASWSAALELAAVADLAARRIAGAAAAGDCAPGEHIADEIAAALTLTGRAADALLDLAMTLRRLPATMTALAAGRVDRGKAAVIADEVGGLGDGHTAVVERHVLGAAPGQTSGQLRAATRRAVLAADPAAVRERKERAQRDARVERWEEHAGTAALAGRDLPPADVLAADHRLSALARSLKRAGAGGTMDRLRAQVYLALLTGQSLTALRPAGAGGPAATPVQPGQSAAGPAPPGGPGLAGSVNLTMPLATWLGLSDAPGDAAGYGPLDAADARHLAALLGGQPGSRWCVTLTGERGRPSPTAAPGAVHPPGPAAPGRHPATPAPHHPVTPGPHHPVTPGPHHPVTPGLHLPAIHRPRTSQTSWAGWPASGSASWKRVTAATFASRPPTARRPPCGT